jgi:hypothetical protein
MELGQFVSEFLGSSQGQNAASALASQHGLPPDMAQQVLSHAAATTHGHVNEHGGGIFGEHAARNFFAAFAAGLVKGDGVWDSMKDGMEGALVGRITEALCDKVGMDNSTASAIAATATPYLADFVKSKLG